MRVDINFGKGSLPVELSDDWQVTVVRKPQMPIEADGTFAVKRALQSPVGCAPFRELARGCSNVCILICDITRPVPNGVILPVLIKELIAAGVEPKAITVLVATGLHRPNEGDDLAALVGNSWVLETVNVVYHFATRDDAHVRVGTPNSGTVVRLARRRTAVVARRRRCCQVCGRNGASTWVQCNSLRSTTQVSG